MYKWDFKKTDLFNFPTFPEATPTPFEDVHKMQFQITLINQ